MGKSDILIGIGIIAAIGGFFLFTEPGKRLASQLQENLKGILPGAGLAGQQAYATTTNDYYYY